MWGATFPFVLHGSRITTSGLLVAGHHPVPATLSKPGSAQPCAPRMKALRATSNSCLVIVSRAVYIPGEADDIGVVVMLCLLLRRGIEYVDRKVSAIDTNACNDFHALTKDKSEGSQKVRCISVTTANGKANNRI